MRNKLVIRGLKEDSDEKESWEKLQLQTGETAVCNLLSQHLKINTDDGKKMIQRAHGKWEMTQSRKTT